MSVVDKVLHYAVDWALGRLSESSDSKNSSGGAVTIVSRTNFREAADEIKQAVANSTAAIVGKIEGDKLEVLISRIRSLGDIIKLGDRGLILSYTFTLREAVDYAENRLNEGKKEWGGPFLMGKAAIFSALQVCCADSAEDRGELEDLCRIAKYQLLDIAVTDMIQKGRSIPWSQIENFLTAKAKLPLLILDESPENNRSHNYVEVVAPSDIGDKVEYKVVKLHIELFSLVKIGQPLIEVQEFKTVFDIETDVAGVIHEILVEVGDIVLPGMLLARVRPC